MVGLFGLGGRGTSKGALVVVNWGTGLGAGVVRTGLAVLAGGRYGGAAYSGFFVGICGGFGGNSKGRSRRKVQL